MTGNKNDQWSFEMVKAPSILCMRQSPTADAVVYLHWDMQWKESANQEGPSSGHPLPYVVFVLERWSNHNTSWVPLGMTTKSVVEVKDLMLATEYAFRITPVSSRGPLLLGIDLTLEVVTPEGFYPNLKGPEGLYARPLGPDSKGLTVRVTWDPDKDLPCFYSLACLPNSNAASKQMHIYPGLRLLGVDVPGLTFDTDYRLLLSSARSHFRYESPPMEISFRTASCLNATGNNFTICEPPAPRNLKIRQVGLDLLISWTPPFGTSADNRVGKYEVTVVNNPLFKNIGQHSAVKIELTTDPSTTETVVDKLEPGQTFQVTVWALSVAGRGKPAVTEAWLAHEMEVLAESPWRQGMLAIILAPVIGVPVCVGVILFLIRWARNRAAQKMQQLKPYRRATPAKAPSYSCPFRVDFNNFTVTEILGKGAFGVVYKGTLTRGSDTQVVAVKMVQDKEHFGDEQRRQLWQEMEMLRLLGRHSHVVCLQGYACSQSTLVLMLEFCPFGDLLSHLRSLGGRAKKEKASSQESGFHSAESNEEGLCFGEDSEVKIWTANAQRLLSYARQVAIGMDYISSCKLVHRDLAARNVLLESAEKVKIADFGLGYDIYETMAEGPTPKKSTRLPLRWMAPEAFTLQNYSTASDAWSFGVLLWEILTLGTIPYPEIPNQEVPNFIKSGNRLKRPDACSQPLYNVMSSCWSIQPEKRPKFSELKDLLEPFLEENYLTLIE